MSIKWSGDANATAGNFSPIPERRYLLKVVKATEGVTSSKRPKVDLEFDVAYGEYEGRKIWHTLTFIPKGEAGHGLTVQALKALGLFQDGELDLAAGDFLERQCEADVVIEEYTDKEDRVKKVNRIATAGFVTDDAPASNPAPAPKAAASPKKAPVPF